MVGQAEEELKKDPAVADYTSVVGLNFIDNYSQANAAFIVVTLKPLEERPGSENSINAMMPRLSEKFREIGGGIVLALAPPPIVGLGIGDGFTCVFEDLQGRSPQALAQVLRGLTVAANQDPKLSRVFSTFSAANHPCVVHRNLCDTVAVRLLSGDT